QVAHIRGLGIIAVGVCCFEEAEEVVTDLTCLARFQPGTVPLLSDPRRVHDARADERTRGQSGSDDCPPVPTNVLPGAPTPRLGAGIERLASQEMIDVAAQRLDGSVSRGGLRVDGGSDDDVEVAPSAAGDPFSAEHPMAADSFRE